MASDREGEVGRRAEAGGQRQGGLKRGGLKRGGLTWDGLTWDGLTWDGLTWDGLTWDGNVTAKPRFAATTGPVRLGPAGSFLVYITLR
ncbi:hypothetical protein Rcae01_03574 [Novipirellula caenicola]|uniref:Uncharacterized protein n=1 Tax=Novipirellula caenicola TaxID=1536901 RepID=A0ABP9VSH4_9BACT